MLTGPAKDFLQPEAAYDLLWPKVITNWTIPLRKDLLVFYSLVVTVGHSKSYTDSSWKKSLVGINKQVYQGKVGLTTIEEAEKVYTL